MNDSFFFIVNSRIGEKKITMLQNSIQKYLPGKDIQVLYTEYGGHATKLAQQAVRSHHTTIVAVGGDGTVNEIVQVVAASQKLLAIIPTGSGNGLARHCNIPIQLEHAVKLLAEGHPLTIDLGKANDKYFISNAGVGFDALVCNQIKETSSRGLKMYILNVVRNYFSYKKDEYTITADNHSFSQKAFFLNAANGKEFGYGFKIAPQASLQDGMLDVILVKNMNAWNGLKFVIDGWLSRIHKNQNCIYFTTEKILIQGKKLNYFQTDGDAHACDGTCEIRVIKNALKLLVPISVTQL